MTSSKPGFLQRLQSKWHLKSLTQVLLVLLVFACTGTTILLIKNPILAFFGIERGGGQGLMNTIAYLLLVLGKGKAVGTANWKAVYQKKIIILKV